MARPTAAALPRPALRVAMRLLAAIAIAGLLPLVMLAGPVVGHSILESSDPSDGAALGTPPSQIRLVFSERVEVDLASVELREAHAGLVAGVELAADPSDEAALLVRLPDLRPGAYRLGYRVVDEEDFHVTTGSLVFGLGQAAPSQEARAQVVPGPGEVVVRWLDVAAIATLAAVFILLVLVVPVVPSPGRSGGPIAEAHDRLRRRMLRLAAIAGLVGLVSGTMLLLIQAASAAGPSLSVAGVAAVLGTGYGIGWAVRQALIVAAIAVAAAPLVLRRRGRGEPSASSMLPFRREHAGLVVIACLAVVEALAGHVAGSGDERAVRVAALSVHLVAVWAWVGALVVLAAIVVPALQRGAGEAALARLVLRRFWRVGAPSLAILGVTGLYLAGQLVASVDGLLQALYGQALIVKVALVALVAFVGLNNSIGLHPDLAAAVRRLPAATSLARLSRVDPAVTVRLEAVGALAVVLVAALMSATPPALGPQYEPIPAVARQPDVVARVDDLLVTVAVRPNQPGPNFIDIGVFDTRRPAPAPIRDVTVAIDSPMGPASASQSAGSLGGGRYELSQTLASPTAVSITVAVRRPGLPDARLTAPWTVSASTRASGSTLVSRTPLAPLTSAVAIVVALLLLALAAAVVMRRFVAGGSRAPSLPAPAGQEGTTQ